jgi:hypothetical protein
MPNGLPLAAIQKGLDKHGKVILLSYSIKAVAKGRGQRFTNTFMKKMIYSGEASGD